MKSIIAKGVRVNNLKDIDLEIPRNKFIVVTGVSGSGKSSLAFDTLYAEGQRRYVESLSSYARQFLGRMSKPECDYIKGLPPAIAIEQKVINRNGRSTVGTSTEIYDYLRLLFSRIGKTYSPISGQLVKKHSVDDVYKCVMSYPKGTKFAILSAIKSTPEFDFKTLLNKYLRSGYSRVEHNGKFYNIADIIKNPVQQNIQYNILIDRISVNQTDELRNRLYDSTEIAFYEGFDECIVKFWINDDVITHTFSKRFEADGMTFQEPNDLMFNFNNPIGACEKCEGYGKIMGIDENLVVPDKSLSVYQDAVMCWRGNIMNEWKNEFIKISSKNKFPIHKPYYQLTDEQKDLLWNGTNEFPGINGFFKWIETKTYQIQYRVLLSRYRGKTICPQCHGSRLKKETQYIKICGYTISDIVKMSISQLVDWFNNIDLDDTDKIVSQRIILEIKNRLNFLNNIGLGYLSLDRLSSTLSGGESQRINLATSLGSSLVGSLYILDEPSIGLHPRDTDKLIKVLKNLQKIGNTVIVVEHDEDIIRSSDYLIDVGPDAGRKGGQIVFNGQYNGQINSSSYTLKYLSGDMEIPVPKSRRKWHNYIGIEDAAENNLKNISVKFPLQIITVVTGVSGSGKSSLVNGILYKSLAKYFEKSGETPGVHKRIYGDLHLIKDVEFVDQNPIGKSTRSNPATYIKAFDEIRKLFASQQSAKQTGITSGMFSFNSPGGRCEECKGEGQITVEMQFMADITLQCDCCHGKRFKPEVLDVEYKKKNIYDVLEMTVNQAIEFFGETKESIEEKIIKRLKPLQDVGLGYIKLGQSSSTLSGGENQRIKLASYIAEESANPTLFIFDEPTTGLHFHDINTLLKSFNKLIEKGHSIIIIEHNLDVIKCADYIIDIGPGGGDSGGNIVFSGTPEELIKCEESYTAKYLTPKIIKGQD